MTGPFIFIATNRLKQGKLNSEQKRLPDLIDFIQANEPRLIAFNEYANEEGTEVAVVQVHPDADSMVFHLELIAERAASAYADTHRRDHEHPGLRHTRRQCHRHAPVPGWRRRAPEDQAPPPRRLHPLTGSPAWSIYGAKRAQPVATGHK
jgi:hypothetical protein